MPAALYTSYLLTMAPIDCALTLYRTTARTAQIRPYARISTSNASYCLQPQRQSLYSQRTFSVSACSRYPRKDSQHKDSINPEATEYSKSATDDESARQHEAAFDPDITDPQEQYKKAGEGRGDKNNPLDVSPANPEVSEHKGDRTEHSGGGERERTSGRSSPKKGSKVA